MTPVLSDLGAQADNINTLIQRLGPLAESGRAAFPSLGRASEVGTRAMQTTRPITQDINNLATSLAPLANDLNYLLVSLRDTGGIERAMDYLFFQMTAINGFDSAGHYLRAGLLLNTCSTYATEKTIGCEATFTRAGASLRAPADDQTQALKGDGRRRTASARSDDAPISLPSAVLPGSTPAPTPTPSSGSEPAAGEPEPATQTSTTAAPTTTTAPADPAPQSDASATPDPTGRLLDYLLGGGK